jgi:hypothetical protein
LSLRPKAPALRPRPQAPLIPRVTGLVCRVPSPWSDPRRLGLLTQGHLCRFLARSPRILPGTLFTGSRDQPNRPYGRPFALSPGSRLYATPQAYTLRQGYGPARPTPKRQVPGLRRRTYPRRHRNLNRFPFRPTRVKVGLRTGLLPADDALPGDPCPFGGGDSHPASLLLPPGSTLAAGPQDLTALLPPNRHAPLPPPSTAG